MDTQFHFDGNCIASEDLKITPAVGWVVKIEGRIYTIKSIVLSNFNLGPFGDGPKLQVNLVEGGMV